MTDMEQRAAAREFAAYWQNRGDEKQETQTFWLTLLQKVLGVEDTCSVSVMILRFLSTNRFLNTGRIIT